MTYILTGVTLEIPSRAERPREPTPSPAAVSGSRIDRPRQSLSSTKVTDAYLKQVYALRGKQAELEKLLTVLGRDLSVGKRVLTLLKSKNASASAIAKQQARCTQIEKAIAVAIVEVKRLAGAANQAAAGAIATGATKQQAVAASDAGMKAAGPVLSESSGASVLPSGKIIPTTSVSVVATPPLTESVPSPPAVDQEPGVQSQGATSSSGGVVLVLGGLGLAYLLLRKKGRA